MSLNSIAVFNKIATCGFRLLSASRTTLWACIVLFPLLADAGVIKREHYKIIDGLQGSGLWLSGKIWSGPVIPDDNLVKQAVGTNQAIIALSDAGQLTQTHVYKDLGRLDLKKTPALLPVDANSSEYNMFWLWGDNVLMDVEYILPGRRIPWRTDYKCMSGNDCRLLTDPKEQFFELSYFLFKQHNAGAHKTKVPTTEDTHLVYAMAWPQADSVPEYSNTVEDETATDLIWKLRLVKMEEELVRAQKGKAWLGDKSEMSMRLAESLNQLYEKYESEADEPYSNPLQVKGYAFFSHSYDEYRSIQTSKRLVYEEQLLEMTRGWEKLKLVGRLDLRDRGYLFVRPQRYPTANSLGGSSYKEPVSVFEYRKDNGSIRMVLGVRTDWTGALMADNYLLEAIRVENVLK